VSCCGVSCHVLSVGPSVRCLSVCPSVGLVLVLIAHASWLAWLVFRPCPLNPIFLSSQSGPLVASSTSSATGTDFWLCPIRRTRNVAAFPYHPLLPAPTWFGPFIRKNASSSPPVCLPAFASLRICWPPAPSTAWSYLYLSSSHTLSYHLLWSRLSSRP
jgi:hypothetical protein